MKRAFCVLLVLLVFASVPAFASGFFPSTDELFGQAMPSLSSVLGRAADEVSETEEGRQAIYRGFTTKDYVAFSRYLGGYDCVVESTQVEDSVLTAVIAKGDATITFVYDDAAGTAAIIYPAGTREENAAHNDQADTEALPGYVETFGVALPSMNPVVNREPKVQNQSDGTVQYRYSNVSEAEYDSFSRYMFAVGCALDAFEAENGIASAELRHGNTAFRFEYDSETRTATITYPELSFVEDDSNATVGDVGLLPLADEAFGVVMPRIALATGLSSDGLIETEDGYNETYANFTDEQYAQFSAYLQQDGCSVVNYSTDAGGVLTINLTKAGSPFTLIYDRAHSSATVRYALGSRPEATPIPKPTPRPAMTPKPKETEATRHVYSETECWATAERYFKNNMSWKNPDSLTIHSHSSTLSDGEYTFLIDYSAQNGFGGYNRNTGMVVVDRETNRVTLAWAG